jgi:hypothetical protein
MADQNKKTMRHFYCRDFLWDTFEQMANDYDCSIDYLINEAMRYYARSKNYAPQAQSVPPQPAQAPQQLQYGQPRLSSPPQPPTAAAAKGAPPASRRPPPPPLAAGGPSFSARRTAHHQPGPQPAQPPAAVESPRGRPAESRPMPVELEEGNGATTLHLIFNNQHIPITKEQFIIGRGSKSSDLAIKDGNISRKHAAIIRRNGTYYIKDLGSTNGIDYKGMRIDNKRIDEGDVFHLCDYELRFTYKG